MPPCLPLIHPYGSPLLFSNPCTFPYQVIVHDSVISKYGCWPFLGFSRWFPKRTHLLAVGWKAKPRSSDGQLPCPRHCEVRGGSSLLSRLSPSPYCDSMAELTDILRGQVSINKTPVDLRHPLQPLALCCGLLWGWKQSRSSSESILTASSRRSLWCHFPCPPYPSSCCCCVVSSGQAEGPPPT